MSRGRIIIMIICGLLFFFTFSIFNPLNRQSLLLDGALSETYYRAAKSSEERGYSDSAKHDYKFALRLNPYHKESKEALQRLGEK